MVPGAYVWEKRQWSDPLAPHQHSSNLCELWLTRDGRRIKGEVVLRTQDTSGWGVCACREGG